MCKANSPPQGLYYNAAACCNVCVTLCKASLPLPSEVVAFFFLPLFTTFKLVFPNYFSGYYSDDSKETDHIAICLSFANFDNTSGLFYLVFIVT